MQYLYQEYERALPGVLRALSQRSVPPYLLLPSLSSFSLSVFNVAAIKLALIYDLLRDAVGSSDNTVLNDKLEWVSILSGVTWLIAVPQHFARELCVATQRSMLANAELERIWKEAILA
jgi:hypothetical protein